MLPPALFYALGFALVFFGVLRLVYLGLRGSEEPTRDRAGHGDLGDDAGAEDGATAAPSAGRGFGLLSFMGGGRMSGPKRHKVMGVLWIVMGLYVAWTGYNMDRSQNLARSESEGPEGQAGVRVIRANVKAPEAEGASRGAASSPPTLRAAPEVAPQP